MHNTSQSATHFLPFTCVTRSRIQWISGESERYVAFKPVGIYAIIGALGTIAVATRDSLHPRSLETNASTIRLVTVVIGIAVSVHAAGGSNGERQEGGEVSRLLYIL